MASKSKKSKKQQPTSTPTPQPAPEIQQPPVTESTALAELAALTADVTCPPWPNKRIAVACPLCGETHASPVAYVGRLARRGTATPDELRWLREHLTASGVQIPA